MARRARPKLVADLMCGAGGTTDGAKAALEELGHDVEFVCLNHWSLAIATHTVNFPAARHYCQHIAAARALAIVPQGYLDLLMAATTCTHHSRARSGRPTSEPQRQAHQHLNNRRTALPVKRRATVNGPESAKRGRAERGT